MDYRVKPDNDNVLSFPIITLKPKALVPENATMQLRHFLCFIKFSVSVGIVIVNAFKILAFHAEPAERLFAF